MPKVPIITMVKCPMLIEFGPIDLVPASDCVECQYLRTRRLESVDCKFGEEV